MKSKFSQICSVFYAPCVMYIFMLALVGYCCNYSRLFYNHINYTGAVTIAFVSKYKSTP